MQPRPVIGVPTQTLQVIDGIPEGLPRSWVMNQRYFLALTELGAVPWMVPLLDSDEATLREIYDRLDGVFLAGGVDMDPATYGAVRSAACGAIDPARDAVELHLAAWAMAEEKPVLGACRGMQVLNVARGGTLYQDFATELPEATKHDFFPTDGHARDFLAHEVRIEPGTRLQEIYGAASIQVNSMHHQGIARLGEGLVASAFSSDGLIEALEGTGDAFVVGVQWHPEMLVERDAGTRRLFEDFLDASLRYTARRSLTASGG